MRGQAILVSGGTGYVGRFVVEHLLSAGRSVSVMGRTAPVAGYFSRPVRFVEGTLNPARDQSAAFEGIDFFVHAAFDHVPGKYRGGEGDDAKGFRYRNHDGSVALFEAARKKGVSRAVFVSSRAVYGNKPASAVLTEETVPHPDTLYGEAKLATENALRRMSGDGFCGTILRVTGVYGPAGKGRDHKWLELFRDYLAGKPIAPRVGTEVHGADVAAAVALVLAAPETNIVGEIFNVSDLLVDRHALLSIVREATGSAFALPPPVKHSAVNVMETAKISALGWRPGGAAAWEKFVRSEALSLDLPV
jgi:nucleoside-diphosphate-sugar epimerase